MISAQYIDEVCRLISATHVCYEQNILNFVNTKMKYYRDIHDYIRNNLKTDVNMTKHLLTHQNCPDTWIFLTRFN